MKDRSGIVCFITVAGFLNGPGFQKMREDLRRDCAAIWVIDCSPEGHQPEVATRIFQGVQQPVCIVLAARSPNKDRETPARLKFIALPRGRREAKFEALAKLSFGDSGVGGRAFRLARSISCQSRKELGPSFPALADFFVWSGPGVIDGPNLGYCAGRLKVLRSGGTRFSRNNDPKRRKLFHPDARRRACR